LPTRFRDFSFCGHFAGHSPPHNGLPALDSVTAVAIHL
jgi:hypothetical protein